MALTSSALPQHSLTQPVFVVDAFTSRAFRGNPAGVCLLPAASGAEWMQLVARELNHAETAFVWPLEGGFSLRWFTPTTEVDLCGHGTLAAAHALWESGGLPPHQVAHFQTLSGALSARRVELGWIELDFPAEVAEETQPPLDMAEVLGAQPLWVGKNRLDYLVELASAAQVRALKPDLGRFGPLGVRGVIVTAAGDDGYDLVSRGFFPNIGIPEDPVTGSAHCALAPYWAAKLGRRELSAYQASARGGELRLRLEGVRVKLLGQAVTTLRGFMQGPQAVRGQLLLQPAQQPGSHLSLHRVVKQLMVAAPDFQILDGGPGGEGRARCFGKAPRAADVGQLVLAAVNDQGRQAPLGILGRELATDPQHAGRRPRRNLAPVHLRVAVVGADFLGDAGETARFEGRDRQVGKKAPQDAAERFERRTLALADEEQRTRQHGSCQAARVAQHRGRRHQPAHAVTEGKQRHRQVAQRFSGPQVIFDEYVHVHHRFAARRLTVPALIVAVNAQPRFGERLGHASVAAQVLGVAVGQQHRSPLVRGREVLAVKGGAADIESPGLGAGG